MYEDLIKESQEEDLEILEVPLTGNLKGLYCSGIIAVSTNIETAAEKSCILSEEMGHHYKTHGNILNMEDIRNVKQEKIARNWAYEKLVPLHKLIEAFDGHYDPAEYLCITDEFLSSAIKHYKEKYGTYYAVDDYIIYFEPHLAILRMF
jgi:hypothetical protein